MATAAASLFVPESLAPNTMPLFREGLGEMQAFFERILEQTFGVAEGIWIGTPFNLNLERESGELERRMAEIRHPHLVLWGEKDGWIPPADLKRMATAMPDCRLVTVPGVGHSMNLEQPALYAGYFGAWFGGLTGDAVRASGQRQSDVERRAAIGMVLCGDLALMCLDDRAGDGQTQAHSIGFCRKEWLKYLFQALGRDAGPCVRYGNLREAINPRGADAHPAPGGGDRRHGVHRVHHQVDDGLLKLNTVTVDRQRLSGRKAVELDGRASAGLRAMRSSLRRGR